MRVCVVCAEFYGWGASGGYGFATRSIGRELVKRGIEVFAVVPQPRGKKETELTIDGIRIRSYSRSAMWRAADVFRSCDADIYHSQEPSLATYIAAMTMPKRKHIITARYPRMLGDWLVEFRSPTTNKLQVLLTCLYYENFLVHFALHRADSICCPTEFLLPKVKKKYRLDTDPLVLPTPVQFPTEFRKSENPTVCYVGRLDRRKRPELFLDLTVKFPTVQFIAAGASQDSSYALWLRERYMHAPNLEVLGFVDQFAGKGLSAVFGKSWILVNTSTREGLPNTFIEACAHGCAILSEVDSDGFASRFGTVVSRGDFARGLEHLLAGDRWRERGQRGYEYVREAYHPRRAIQLHLAEYTRLLGGRAASVSHTGARGTGLENT